MDKLPAAIEEKIHELLADDAKSIGSLLRLTRHHARDRRLWRKLLTTSCPGYEPSDDTSIDDLKAFVLSFDEKPYGWWKQVTLMAEHRLPMQWQSTNQSVFISLVVRREGALGVLPTRIASLSRPETGGSGQK